MKRVAPLLLALLFLPLTWAFAAGNPFDGWADEKVENSKKAAKSRISGKLRRYQTARKGLVFRCSTCQGGGKIRRRQGRAIRIVDCVACKGTGGCISKEKFLLVFWEFRSPKYRSSKERMREVEELYKKARLKSRDAVDFLGMIDKWKRKSIDVKGNHAILTFTEKSGGAEVTRQAEWILVDKKWWVADKEVDSTFVRYSYEDRKKETAAEPAKKPEPEKKPDPAKPAPAQPAPTNPEPSEPVPAKPEPVKPPPAKPKKPLEDPDKLFRLSEPTFRHVEENAYKVVGQVTNKTEKRRFAYITVEVSLFKGDDLVDSVRCNIGTVILKPGRSGSYVGHFYFDKKPKYDKIVAKVASYEEME